MVTDTDLRTFGIGLLELLLYLVLAPAALGIKQLVFSRLQRRQGQSIYQPYLDIYKRFRQVPPHQQHQPTTWISRSTPIIVFGSILFLALAVPPFGLNVIPLDLISAIYLIGLARFCGMLAGMEAGVPFTQIGASREMFVNILAEPILLLAMVALAQRHGTSDLLSIFQQGPQFLLANYQSLQDSLLSFGLFILALAGAAVMDLGIMPFDYLPSHYELTYRGKGPQLEWTGWQLALIEWAESIRLLFFLTLLTTLMLGHQSFLPTLRPGSLVPLSPGFSTALSYAISILGGLVFLAIYEVANVRLAFNRIFSPWLVAIVLICFAILLKAYLKGGGQ